MHKIRERKGYERGTARNFLHSFPLSVSWSSSHIGHGKSQQIYGAKFYTPHPPTPENTLLGAGGCIKGAGGGYKIPATWGFKICTPTPSPENAFKPEMGGGRGGGRILRPEPPFTGVSGPSGHEIAKKSQKGSFWGVWRKVSKNTRKSLKIAQKYPKRSENRYSETFSGIF